MLGLFSVRIVTLIPNFNDLLFDKAVRSKYTTKLKNSLSRHLDAVHNFGEKRFKCDVCPYSAAQGKYVRFHMASVHNIGEKFKCDKCPYSTPDKSTLKKHQGSKGCKGFPYKQMNINNQGHAKSEDGQKLSNT